MLRNNNTIYIMVKQKNTLKKSRRQERSQMKTKKRKSKRKGKGTRSLVARGKKLPLGFRKRSHKYKRSLAEEKKSEAAQDESEEQSLSSDELKLEPMESLHLDDIELEDKAQPKTEGHMNFGNWRTRRRETEEKNNDDDEDGGNSKEVLNVFNEV